MLKELGIIDPTLSQPWPAPRRYALIVESSWGSLLISRLVTWPHWKHSPVLRDLENAIENLEKAAQKLAEHACKSCRFHFVLPCFCPYYREFSAMVTHLEACLMEYYCVHEQDERLWTDMHLGTPGAESLRPDQWNLRAELASQSSHCYAWWEPLEQRTGVFLTFPPELRRDIQITRIGMHRKRGSCPAQLPNYSGMDAIERGSPFFSSSPPPPYSEQDPEA